VLFFGNLEPKPAFWGAVGDLAALGQLRGLANAFGGAFTRTWAAENHEAAMRDIAWLNTPPQELTDGVGEFRARWNTQDLVLLITLQPSADTLEVTFDGNSELLNLDGTGPSAETTLGDSQPSFFDGALIDQTNLDGTTQIIVFLPDAALVHGSTAQLDVRALRQNTSGTGYTDLGGWNSPGNHGVVTPIEPLSFTQALAAANPPVGQALFDPAMGVELFDPAGLGAGGDPTWGQGLEITTGVTQSGATDGATAVVHTLWYQDTLYVRFDVTDPTPDTSASEPWEQDSVEVFLDLGNAKNGEYRPWHDMQVRVGRNGEVTFGAGEPGRQQDRLTNVSVTEYEGGYVVELAIGLWTINEHQSRVDYSDAGTFQGFDVQVNDASGGARTAVHSWANPTDQGFQDTTHWGVIQLAQEPLENLPTDGAANVSPGVPSADGSASGEPSFPVLPFLIGVPVVTGLAVALWASLRRPTKPTPNSSMGG